MAELVCSCAFCSEPLVFALDRWTNGTGSPDHWYGVFLLQNPVVSVGEPSSIVILVSSSESKEESRSLVLVGAGRSSGTS